MISEPSKLTQLMLYLEGYYSSGKPELLSKLMDDVQAEQKLLCLVARVTQRFAAAGYEHPQLDWRETVIQALDNLPAWALDDE